MMFSLEEESLIPDETLKAINTKLHESDRYKDIRIVERGSDEHLAALHVDTPSEISDAASGEPGSDGVIEEAENSQASYEAVIQTNSDKTE
jgi:hypothetical protein